MSFSKRLLCSSDRVRAPPWGFGGGLRGAAPRPAAARPQDGEAAHVVQTARGGAARVCGSTASERRQPAAALAGGGRRRVDDSWRVHGGRSAGAAAPRAARRERRDQPEAVGCAPRLWDDGCELLAHRADPALPDQPPEGGGWRVWRGGRFRGGGPAHPADRRLVDRGARPRGGRLLPGCLRGGGLLRVQLPGGPRQQHRLPGGRHGDRHAAAGHGRRGIPAAEPRQAG